MPQQTKKPRPQRPKQSQPKQPGEEKEMKPRPIFIREDYRGSGKLEGKVALITGGDSGIGRAAAVAFAREGADVAIIYLNEDADAKETARLIEAEGRRALLIARDIAKEGACEKAVKETVKEFGRIDVLVNNAAQQFPQKSIEDITEKQLDRTFRINIYSMFFLTKAALPHMRKGSSIINTTSVTAYRGS